MLLGLPPVRHQAAEARRRSYSAPVSAFLACCHFVESLKHFGMRMSASISGLRMHPASPVNNSSNIVKVARC